MNLRRLFTEHPESVGETYLQHLCAASWFAARMFTGAIACFVHALLPFTFRHTGSECISELHERMVVNRNRSVPRTGSVNHTGAPRANAAR